MSSPFTEGQVSDGRRKNYAMQEVVTLRKNQIGELRFTQPVFVFQISVVLMQRIHKYILNDVI